MVTERHQSRVSQGAEVNTAASLRLPLSPATRVAFPLRPAPRHQNWFLPPARGLALWSSLSFSIAQLDLTGHATGTRAAITKLSVMNVEAPLFLALTLELPPAPPRNYTASNMCLEEDPSSSPLSNLSYIYTILQFSLLFPCFKYSCHPLGQVPILRPCDM